MLARILEPEVMDTADDGREYDAMDHAAVNTVFVNDLLAAINGWSPMNASPSREYLKILDVGVGTAQIPIELVRRAPNFEVVAVDAAESMLAVAAANIESAGVRGQIDLFQGDAKELPFDSSSFPVVISNSIMHHIPQPQFVIKEAIRITSPGGLLFHRDLARPHDESTLQQLVNTYAAESNSYQRRLFEDSLRAALTADEMATLVSSFGFDRATVRMTSDRHWTWLGSKPSRSH